MTSPKVFFDEMIVFMNVGRAVGVVYLSFSKEFNIVSYNVIHKLMKYGLDMWTVRWIENCLTCWAHGLSSVMWCTPGVDNDSSSV